MSKWGLLDEYLGGDIIVANKLIARRFDLQTAVLLRDLAYWYIAATKKGLEWCFRTQAEIEEETTLSDKVQVRCRKILCDAGVLEESRAFPGGRLHFKLNREKLQEIIEGGNIPDSPNGGFQTLPTGDSGIPQREVPIELVKEASEIAGLGTTYLVGSDPSPDPSLFFLEPDASPSPSSAAPPSPEPAFPDDLPSPVLPRVPPPVKVRDPEAKLTKQERGVIQSRAHALISGYYTAMGLSRPRMEPQKSQDRMHFDEHALRGIYTAEDVEGCTRFLLTNPFWDDKLLRPSEVSRNLEYWVNNGRPEEQAKPISRAQQRNQSFSADLKSSHDRAYNLIKQRMGLSDAPEPDDDSIEVPYVVNQ